jgi:protein required for attachment to host cells
MTRRHQTRRPEATWVVVADRAHARILTTSQADHKDLKEIKSLVHAEGAAHSRDVLTDRPGRFAGQSGECSAGDPETNFRHQTATDFACQVVRELESGREHNQFGRVVLIAPALFLGTLRKHLSGPLEKLIAAELDKELVYAAPTELAEHVRQALDVDATPLD